MKNIENICHDFSDNYEAYVRAESSYMVTRARE